MSGIIIPSDRTTKQKPRGYCTNQKCLEFSEHRRFEFDLEHDHMACPKCGATDPPMVGLLALTHFLVPNPKGRIKGEGGLRYNIACDPSRAYMATETNDEHCTGDLGFVTCAGCLLEAKKRNLSPIGGSPLMFQKR